MQQLKNGWQGALMAPNRQQKRERTRAGRREMKQRIAAMPDKLTPVNPDDWPEVKGVTSSRERLNVWISKEFLVQVFAEPADIIRLSVNRTGGSTFDGQRVHYKEDIGWDDLQRVKADLGYGECYAIEIYPAASLVVNVANMRHLWLLPEPLPIGWGYEGDGAPRE